MTDYSGLRLGNYQLERLLGQGGFADVYLGMHVYLKTQVAIKVLQTRLTGEDVDAFLNEARTIASLVHPHIVRVLDSGIENSLPFLVMDYAPHGTLRRLFPRGAAQPPTKLVPYVKQVASALQYAHERNLVHRDIKPENMLIGREGEVLLSDFGIATAARSSRSQEVAETAGTVIYMAPEQLRGKPRAASDQYALGIVVYEWLSGNPPFQGTFSEVASQHLFADLPSLRQKVPSLSPALEAVVRHALAKDPHQRFATIAEFAHAFESACILPSSYPFSPIPASSQDIYMTVPMPSQASIPTMINTPSQPPQELSASAAQVSSTVTPSAAPIAASVQTRQAVSRRGLLFGLVGGLVVVAVGALGGYELAQSHGGTPTPGITATSGAPAPTPTPKPTTAPTSSPVPVGTTLLTYRGHRNYVYSVTWSPDGQNIASASNDHSVQIWNATSGALAFSYAHNGAANSVAWSPDGALIASSGEDNVVRVVNANNGNSIIVYQGHTASVYEVKFSPDSTRISSVSADKTIRIWDAQTGNTVLIYSGHTARVWAVAWSPDGRYIASGGDDRTVRVWDAQSGKTLYTFRGHSDRVWAVNWSPNYTRLVTGGKDATAQVWDAPSGNHLYIYRGHNDTVFDAAWSPGRGTRIVSGSSDSTVQIWEAV